jgi:UDP-glucuronate 4-epimerase
MQRALVTGVAGFIGSHLAERLLGEGIAVVGLDSYSPHYERALKELNVGPLCDSGAFTLVEGDLLDAPLTELLEGVDCVFHLAARPGVRDSWVDFSDYVHNNVMATKVLLDGCVGRPLRLVFASSSSVYGDSRRLPVNEDAPLGPISPYGATKVMTEVMVGAYAAAHGLEAVGLRYFTVYGPRQRPDMGLARFIEATVAGRSVSVYGDGRQLRDFTYVADVVAATVAAARRGAAGAVYNIASSSPRELLAVLHELGEVLGQPLELVHEEAKTGDVRDTWGDTSRARDTLGFAPATELRDGLAAQAQEASRRRASLAAR